MSIERIERHFGDALVKLVPPLWGKPRIASLLRGLINRVQEFEDACIDVMNAFNVDTCDAARLDVLGRVVVQPNLGWNTETYRNVVRAKIATNRSRGLEADIMLVLQLAMPTSALITLWAFAPATSIVCPQDTITDDGFEACMFLLPKARPAGVQQHVFFSRSGAVAPYDYATAGFLFSDVVAPLTTPGAAWYDSRTL